MRLDGAVDPGGDVVADTDLERPPARLIHNESIGVELREDRDRCPGSTRRSCERGGHGRLQLSGDVP